MARTHLVSFADGAFRSRREGYAETVRQFGLFDTFHFHGLDTLPAAFRAAHEDFMRRTPRGFGYWIWKPVIIREALRAADAADTVVYVDAGFTLNPGGQRRFGEYIELMQAHPERMLSFQNVFTEAHWTKMDLALRLGLDRTAPHLKTSQFGSGLLVLGKTESNLDLLEAWAALAVEEGYRFSDDTPSVVENHPDFQEHRHDQSIASLLRKMRGTAVTHYEVQGYQKGFETFRDQLPFWATRLRK